MYGSLLSETTQVTGNKINNILNFSAAMAIMIFLIFTGASAFLTDLYQFREDLAYINPTKISVTLHEPLVSLLHPCVETSLVRGNGCPTTHSCGALTGVYYPYSGFENIVVCAYIPFTGSYFSLYLFRDELNIYIPGAGNLTFTGLTEYTLLYNRANNHSAIIPTRAVTSYSYGPDFEFHGDALNKTTLTTRTAAATGATVCNAPLATCFFALRPRLNCTFNPVLRKRQYVLVIVSEKLSIEVTRGRLRISNPTGIDRELTAPFTITGDYGFYHISVGGKPVRYDAVGVLNLSALSYVEFGSPFIDDIISPVLESSVATYSPSTIISDVSVKLLDILNFFAGCTFDCRD